MQQLILYLLSIIFLLLGSWAYTSFIHEESPFFREPIVLIVAFSFMGFGFKYLFKNIFVNPLTKYEKTQFLRILF